MQCPPPKPDEPALEYITRPPKTRMPTNLTITPRLMTGGYAALSCSLTVEVINLSNLNLGVISTAGAAWRVERYACDPAREGSVWVQVKFRTGCTGTFDVTALESKFSWITAEMLHAINQEWQKVDPHILSKTWEYSFYFEISLDQIRNAPKGVFLEELGLLFYDYRFFNHVAIPPSSQRNAILESEIIPFNIKYVRHSVTPHFAFFSLGLIPHRVTSVYDPKAPQGIYIGYANGEHGPGTIEPTTSSSSPQKYIPLDQMAAHGYYTTAESWASGNNFAMKDKDERDRVLIVCDPGFKSQSQIKEEKEERIQRESLLRSTKWKGITLESWIKEPTAALTGIAGVITAVLGVVKLAKSVFT